MIKVLKSHVCLYALTTSVFFFIPNISAGAQDSKPSCSSLFKSYSCDALKNLGMGGVLYADNFDTGPVDAMSIRKSHSVVIKYGTEINSEVNKALQINGSETITLEVFASKKEMVILDDISVTLEAKEGKSRNGKKESSNDKSISKAVFGVEQGGSLFVNNGKVSVTDIHGLLGQSSPMLFEERSFSNVRDGYMSEVFMKDTDVSINGQGAHGLYFRGGLSQDEYEEGELLALLGEFQFENTSFKVPNGTVIYSDDARRNPYITLLDGSSFSGDLLLDVKNHSFVSLEAIASSIVGGTRVDDGSYAGIELSHNSQWTVTPTKQWIELSGEKNTQQNAQHATSSLSLVRLVNSSIVFQKTIDGNYQTLRIGELRNDHGLDYAYAAGGKARLYINAYLGDDRLGNVSGAGNKADKLVIYGNVYGTTTVYVQEFARISKEKVKAQQSETKVGNENRNRGISIIQVYGQAAKDSFKLPGGYGVLKGAPYRYRLKAYAPTSSLEKTNTENGLGKSSNSNGEFWDFRLEREYINLNSTRFSSRLRKDVSRRRVSRSIGSSVDHNDVLVGHDNSVSYSEMGVSAVVPQVPTYLLLPNALFHAGLIDISNQNKQLEESRAAVGGFLENSENPAFFVRSYGGNSRYVSDLSDLEYGYGGDLGYHAVEAGVLLKAMKSADYSTSFGIMGTYGKISLQPQDVVESKKSAFNKWSLTAYGGVQHDTGFYLNGLFSYGLFTGDVLTLVRGKTAELKGNALSVSLSGGKSFMTGYEGLVFDPQVQVIYQNLQFDKASDIDGFDIDMGKPNQWVMRVGGRLSKTLAVSQTGGVVSFNGKLHFTHRFGEKQFVHFGDKFQLGAFGSSLEAGVGFNAQLSSMVSLHGDVTYQHKLSKAGFSGTRFSGGLHYLF